MQIATWNVNSIRTRLDAAIAWLQEHPVDVLCLQETKVIDADFPRQRFEQLGYHLYISGQKAYNGVALISREPLENVSAGFTPILGSETAGNFDEQKRVITGICQGVRIVNLYVPNGSSVDSEKYVYKLSWLQVLRTYLQALINNKESNHPSALCVCGDFNIALEDKDIYNPKGREKQVMATEAERQALRTVLELGLADAFRKFTTEGGHFTWWDYRASGFEKNRGWRIDHHYLTPELYAKATSCTIDIAPRKQPQPSDHVPVIVTV